MGDDQYNFDFEPALEQVNAPSTSAPGGASGSGNQAQNPASFVKNYRQVGAARASDVVYVRNSVPKHQALR